MIELMRYQIDFQSQKLYTPMLISPFSAELEIDMLRSRIAKAEKNAIPHAKKILKNGDYMTVLWQDGTNTVVKRASDEAQSDYAAFTAALGIKCFGSNSALKRIVASAEVQGKKKKKKQSEGEILRGLEDIKEGNRAAYKHDNRG